MVVSTKIILFNVFALIVYLGIIILHQKFFALLLSIFNKSSNMRDLFFSFQTGLGTYLRLRHVGVVSEDPGRNYIALVYFSLAINGNI